MLILAAVALVACSSEKISEIEYKVENAEQGATLAVNYAKTPVVLFEKLGLLTELDSASVWNCTESRNLPDGNIEYDMLIGKSLHCSNIYTAEEFTLTDAEGREQLVEVRVFPDGFALRYTLGKGYEQPVRLLSEHTTWSIPSSESRRWLMRWSDSSEGFFPENPEEKEEQKWGFPALFEPAPDVYALFTEAEITRGHAASNFFTTTPGHYNVRQAEMESQVQSGWQSPWRVCIVGSMDKLIESTLVTDLASPCKLDDTSWIEPGVVSWIYWAYNHGSNDYNIIAQYIDMAAELKLPYMLIDAEWDEMKDGKTIEDALNYAHEKGVKPMIWYNSTTNWIDWAPGPKWRLNKAEDREKEFQWCEDHGVAGIKIDFFEHELERCMNYCIDLLESAAKHHLLVNFHGATIPRGWMRTYPNLVSTEAVYGAEWYNNRPILTDRAACHNATLPFTRGIIGSMDYTPCTFTDSQHPHITTHAHELALTVLFESGLQHLADRPSAYLSQPQRVKDFFSTLPSVWDETRLLAGEVGKYVILYRRLGDNEYIAGINGTDEELTLPEIEIPFDAIMFLDNDDKELPWRISNVAAGVHLSMKCMPRGGFVFQKNNNQ